MAVEILNDTNFNQVLEDNRLVVVKYFADWCGSCKLFAPKYRRLSEDERFTNIKFVEVNAEENPEARKLSNVDNLPFFAVFKEGKLIDGGSTSKEEKVVEYLQKII